MMHVVLCNETCTSIHFITITSVTRTKSAWRLLQMTWSPMCTVTPSAILLLCLVLSSMFIWQVFTRGPVGNDPLRAREHSQFTAPFFPAEADCITLMLQLFSLASACLIGHCNPASTSDSPCPDQQGPAHSTWCRCTKSRTARCFSCLWSFKSNLRLFMSMASPFHWAFRTLPQDERGEQRRVLQNVFRSRVVKRG